MQNTPPPPPRKRQEPTPFDMGKIPPQAIDAEVAVLGAIILITDTIIDVVQTLTPESFYIDAHQKIYSACMDMFYANEPIDIISVTMELKKRGELEEIGGAYYIATELVGKVGSNKNVEFHAAIIQQQYIKRSIIAQSSAAIKEAFEDSSDPFDLLGETQKNLFDLSSKGFRKDIQSAKELVAETIKSIETVASNPDVIKGVPSGFMALDRETSGWQKSDLIIIAARPGMGKTALALTLARNAAINKTHTAFFSLEMSSQQLMTRLFSSEAEIDLKSVRNADLRDDQWIDLNKASGVIADSPLYIDDSPSLPIYELQAKCRRLKAKGQLELVIVDYLQLMKGDTGKNNREQEISSISRALKALAKELEIPVIALAQLGRDVEKRGGAKRPLLSDLRESGAIEQDADMVIFLYRGEYYGFIEDDNGRDMRGLADLIIAKNRNGSLSTIETIFQGRYTKFKPAYSEPTIDTTQPINAPAFDFDDEIENIDNTPF